MPRSRRIRFARVTRASGRFGRLGQNARSSRRFAEYTCSVSAYAGWYRPKFAALPACMRDMEAISWIETPCASEPPLVILIHRAVVVPAGTTGVSRAVAPCPAPHDSRCAAIWAAWIRGG